MNKKSLVDQSMFASYFKVGTWTGLSRVFGLLRDITTTALLGSSMLHDIFVVVLKIPNVFRRFFAEGAFSQAFIPIYSEYQEHKTTEEIKDFIDSLAGTLLAILFIFTIVALLFAPVFIFIFAPGFYYDPVKKDIAVDVLRIMFPYLGLISLVAFAGGIQNSHQKYSLPAATPIVFNVCIILSAFVLAPLFSIPIIGLAWGVLLAGFIQLLIQLAPLSQINRLPVPKIDFNNKGIKKVLVLMLPALIAGGVAQINLLIDTIFASLLITGSPTWLYVSDRLIQFPLGIFAIAIGTVLLPSLSKANQKGDLNLYKEQLKKSQKLVIFLAIPSLIGLSICAEHLISTLFQRGEFLYSDVIQASKSLIAFSIGLPFFMMMKVLVPAFFSRKDTKTPMYAAIAALLVNVILNYIFAIKLGYGHIGLALASSIAAILSSSILFIILVKDNYIQLSNPLNKFNAAILIASLAVILFLLNSPFNINFDSINFAQRLMYLSLEVGISALLYFGLAKVVLGNRLRELF
jgi:putative peptidoglycan lipid II flippase